MDRRTEQWAGGPKGQSVFDSLASLLTETEGIREITL
jgi:hypothetical protein